MRGNSLRSSGPPPLNSLGDGGVDNDVAVRVDHLERAELQLADARLDLRAVAHDDPRELIRCVEVGCGLGCRVMRDAPNGRRVGVPVVRWKAEAMVRIAGPGESPGPSGAMPCSRM